MPRICECNFIQFTKNSCLFIPRVFFNFWSEIFTFINRKMHTFDLLIIKCDTLWLLIVKCVTYDRGNPQLLIVGVRILRLIIEESTIIKHRWHILRLIIVESSYDADLLSTPNISRGRPPLPRKLHTPKLHLTELALK